MTGSPAASLESVPVVLTYYDSQANDLGTTAPTAPGDYSVVGSFAGSTDYLATSTAPTPFSVVTQTVPTITLTDSGGPETGSPYPATATISPNDGGDGTTLEGVGLTLTYYPGNTTAGTPLTGRRAPGTYTVMASFPGSDDYAAVSTSLGFTVTSGVLQAGGLEFQTEDGSAFGVSGGVYTASAGVQFGFVPASDQSFTPLAELDGNVSINTLALTLAGTGTLSAVISGTPIPLVTAGLGTTSITTLVNEGLSALSGTAIEVAGTTFTIDSIQLNPVGPELQLQGSIALPIGLTVAVNGSNDVDISSSGVSLTGVTATLNGSFTLAGVTFNASQLQVAYTAASQTFAITGQTSITAGEFGTVSLDLGGGSTQGVVITDGVLTGLDATASLDATLGGGTLTATGVNVVYVPAEGQTPDQLAIGGAADLSFGGNFDVSLTLGSSTSPGVLIQGGALASLDATASLDMTLAGATFSATGVNVDYVAASASFAVSGSASLDFPSGPDLSLTLGSAAQPGLVFSNGTLTSLDATASFSMTLAGATFSATDVNVTYIAASGNAPDQFNVSGSASLDFPTSPDMSLTLGSSSQPGLVLSGGALVSLDATASFSMTLAGATFTATDVNVTYVTASDDLEISGSASLAFGTTVLSLTLGSAAQPGLAFTGGTLTSLDATAGLNATLGGARFSASALNLTYTAASGNTPAEFTVTGVASLSASFRGAIESIAVDFGGGSTTGLVLSGGTIESLNMTVTSSFVAGGVTFGTNGLIATYVASATSPEVTFTGNAHFSVAGVGTVAVDLGGPGTQGLVIINDALASLNMTVTSSLKIGGVSFTTSGLTITENVAARVFTVTGGASLAAGKLANVQVEFGSPASNGNAGSTGLVITGGTLTSLDMTVNSTITEAGVTLTADGLHFVYNATASPATFSLGGTTTASFPGLGSFSVTLGTAAHPSGLLIQGSNLVSLGMTVNAALSVGKVTFNANKLAFDYTASSDLYQISGTTGVAIAGLGTLQVTFGTASHPDGVVISNGALASLGVVVNGSFTVAKVGFTATKLELDYTANTQTFQIIGTAGASIGNIGSLSVTFAGSGLVITNGALQKLDASISGGFSVAGLAFSSPASNPLQLIYVAATASFDVTGSATVAVTYFDASITVSFPGTGLVIRNGALVSLDAAVSGGFKVAGLSFSSPAASPLQLNYVAATSTVPASFDVTGSATVAVTYFDASITVSFPGTGLVIDAGKLVSLDAAVSGGFKVAGLSFSSPASNPLQLNYVAATSTVPASFDITGSATVAVTYFDASITVSFAGTGLVVKSGKLVSLDAAVSGGFKVAGLSFSSPAASPLHLKYVAATPPTAASFDITGPATVAVTHFDASITVSFPGTGLVIKSGKLVSLDAAVNGGFKVAGLSFSSPAASPLQLNYVPATASFDVTGSATVTIQKFASLGVSFLSSGLVIKNGTFQSIDVSVTSNFAVGKVGFATRDLDFGYTVSTNTFFLKGSADVTVGGIAGLTVGFGTTDAGILKSNPAAAYGIVITNGSLTNLAMYISANFIVGGVQIYTKDLGFDYTPSTSTYEITGTAGINVGGITSQNNGVNAPGTNSLSITFGGPLDPAGILIQNGQLTSLDAEINASFWIDDLVQIKATNLEFAYESNYNKTGHSAFLMAGAVGAALPYNIGNVTVTFGSTTGDPGLVITNGQLVSFDATISAGITLPGIGLALGNVSVTFAYTSANNEYTLTGTGALTLDGIVTIGVALGTPATATAAATPGLMIENGTLKSVNITASGALNLGPLEAQVNLTGAYTASTTTLAFGGTAGVSFNPSNVPSWVRPFFGLGSSNNLGTAGFYVSIDANDVVSSNSYAKFWVSEGSEEIGLEVNFDKKVSISLGTGSAANVIMGYVTSQPFDATAVNLAKVELAIAGGIAGNYTTSTSALISAWLTYFEGPLGGLPIP